MALTIDTKALAQALDAVVQAVHTMVDAVAQLIGGNMDAIMEELAAMTTLPPAPSWQRVPVILPGATYAWKMAARRMIPP